MLEPVLKNVLVDWPFQEICGETLDQQIIQKSIRIISVYFVL